MKIRLKQVIEAIEMADEAYTAFGDRQTRKPVFLDDPDITGMRNNELGALLNPASSYHAFQPDITFLIMDLAELLEHDYDPQTAKERIGNWFQTLEGCIKTRWKDHLF